MRSFGFVAPRLLTVARTLLSPTARDGGTLTVEASTGSGIGVSLAVSASEEGREGMTAKRYADPGSAQQRRIVVRIPSTPSRRASERLLLVHRPHEHLSIVPSARGEDLIELPFKTPRRGPQAEADAFDSEALRDSSAPGS